MRRASGTAAPHSSFSFPGTRSPVPESRVGAAGGRGGEESERSCTAGAGRRRGRRGTGAPALRPPGLPAPRRPLISPAAVEAAHCPAPAPSCCVLPLHGAPRAAAAPRPGAGPGSRRHPGGPRQVTLPAGAAAQPAPGPAARVSRPPAGAVEGRAGDSGTKPAASGAPSPDWLCLKWREGGGRGSPAAEAL